MAKHGKHYSSARSRKTSRKVSDATIGTHVAHGASGARAASQPKSVSYSNARISERASESHLDTFMPTATSGEDMASYRRRSQQRRYIESMQRKARIRRILTVVLALVVVAGVALGAGWLAFRGVLGSQMALHDSNALEALSTPAEDETVYTLVTAELGAVAAPLEQEGPDMILLVAEDRTANVCAIISIPASLKVTVDNDTRRLADMAQGGDASLISAIESYTKLDIHHLIKLDEGDIAGIVDAFGDVELNFDQVIDDQNAGDVYYPIGTYVVNGQGALTYLRANNLHMGKNDQMINQANFAKTLLGRMVGSERGFTAELETIDEYFQTDLSLSALEDFAKWIGEIGVESVSCSVVPGYYTVTSDVVGTSDELFVSKSPEFAEFMETILVSSETDGNAPATIQAADPTSFTVEIRNGTDIMGAGKTTAEALAALGFRIADVGNAEQQVYDETLVIFHTSNTPAPAPEPVLDENGEVIDTGEGESANENAAGDAVQGQQQASGAATPEEKLAAEREVGQSRAQAVIDALGIGRVVEGDMYYSFDADVLLIIGYDYKPVV
ncbi:MAG: LCP family protein [Eggerthellaceae bacterium]|nr:LCP family protein [Eggerthellaceae bacterium]